MQTTEQWLKKVINNNEYKIHWLKRQYIGELGAAERILELAKSKDTPEKFVSLIKKIASDERQHAEWAKKLLEIRGISTDIELNELKSRYWEPIIDEKNTFEDMVAAGHYAEGMRLVRIKALCESNEIDKDIKEVFEQILSDETFHEKAFGAMATQQSLDKMKNKHEAGLKSLGLEI